MTTSSKPRVSVTPGDWDAIGNALGADFKRKRNKLIAVISKITEDQQKVLGKFVVADGQAYMLDGVDRQPYRIDARDARFCAFLAYRYGLERSEPVTKSLVNMLEAMARARGERVAVHRFAWYNREAGELYLSRYDGTAWRLDGRRFDIVANGDGVLFLDDDDAESAGDFDPTPTVQGTIPDGGLFRLLVDDLSWRSPEDGGASPHLTPSTQSALLKTWIHCVAFTSVMATRPILLLEGVKGSGKTAAIQRIQLALTGKSYPMIIGESAEDFGVQLLRSPVVCLDNVDSNKPWLRDAMCTYTSSGGDRKRKRYSDTDYVNVRPEGLIAVTSRNPTTFRRDDLADRCLVLRLDRRVGDFAGSEIFDDVRAARPKMFAEYLCRLNMVVARLRDMERRRHAHRLADFAQLAHAVGEGSLGASPDDVAAWLRAAEAEREALTLESDPLIIALDRWMPEGIGHSVTAAELYAALARRAGDAGVKWYDNARALASRISNIGPAIENRYNVVIHRSPSHAGVFRYTFAPRASERAVD